MVALVVQLGLVSYFALQADPNKATAEAKSKLIDIALDNIDEIQIVGVSESREDAKLTLHSENGKWQLPNYYNFEANQDKVKRVIGGLLQLNRGWVVASSKSATEKFKVKADDFERKIIFLLKGRTVQTLIIGAAPRFKYAYARLETEGNIYEIPCELHEVSTAHADWVNSTYLYREKSDIAKITLPKVTINRDATNDKQFGVDLAGVDLDQVKVEALLYRLSHITLQDIIVEQERKDIAGLAPKYEYSVQRSNGDVLDYKIYEIKDKPYYALSLSGEKFLFKVDKHSQDEILATGADTLKLDANVESNGAVSSDTSTNEHTNNQAACNDSNLTTAKVIPVALEIDTTAQPPQAKNPGEQLFVDEDLEQEDGDVQFSGTPPDEEFMQEQYEQLEPGQDENAVAR